MDAHAHHHTHDHEVSVDDLSDRFLKKREELEVDKLFRALVKLEGSDLHLKTGRPPMVRVDGTLRALNRGPIETEEMCRLLFPMMNKRSRNIFDEDYAYVLGNPMPGRTFFAGLRLEY